MTFPSLAWLHIYIYIHNISKFSMFSALLLHLLYVSFRATLTVSPRVHTQTEDTNILVICVGKKIVLCNSCTIASRIIKVLFSYFKVLTLLVYCTVQEKYCCWEKKLYCFTCVKLSKCYGQNVYIHVERHCQDGCTSTSAI